MVRLIIALLLVHMPLSALSSPTLRLLFEQNTQQLGYAFNATLIATGSKSNLSEIDLAPLRKNFGILVKEYSSVDKGQHNSSQQQLSMELYPRRTGIINVPSLLFAASHSSSFEVDVLQAKTANGPINIEYKLSTTQPWQRQQVLLTVALTTPDKFSRIDVENPQITHSEFKAITVSKETLSNAIQLTSGWAIFPLESGAQTTSFPAVLYHTQGIIERRFYPPEIQLNVKSLPNYIPPLMPVGKIDINSSVNAKPLLNTGNTYNWEIHLHSNELLSRFLPPILRQIQSNADIDFLSTESSRNDVINSTSATGEVIHRIRFKALSNGKITLPKIRVQYFDPVKGRVIHINHNPESLWSLAIYWQAIIGLLLLLTVFKLVKYTWLSAKEAHRKRNSMNMAMLNIRDASNGAQLWDALHMIAKAESWPENMSMGKWNEYWNDTYTPKITPIIEALSSINYMDTTHDINDIKTELLISIKKRKHNRRWSFSIKTIKANRIASLVITTN